MTTSKYTYLDARDGTKYELHTCTDADEEDRLCGDQFRFTIMEGGDHTVTDSNRFTKRTLPISALGSKRI
jgi:hypothetical protein